MSHRLCVESDLVTAAGPGVAMDFALALVALLAGQDKADDLARALDSSPAARVSWDGFPPSARKQMLWWVVTAARSETRATRIGRIVDEAAEGRRAQG